MPKHEDITHLRAEYAARAQSAEYKHRYSLFNPAQLFTILHFSYGMGFLIGLIKFWDRWGDKTGQTAVWSSEAIE